MELEFVLTRLGGLYLILEFLTVALNQIPDTPEKWKVKKHNAIRRLCYYLALNVAAIWILTL